MTYPTFGRSARRTIPALLLLALPLGGCMAAVGAAAAAGEIRRGFVGVQELVSGARALRGGEAALFARIESPMPGTFQGFQALDGDTLRFFIRTLDRPTVPILDDDGSLMGYVLPGLAATSLDTLEQRIARWTDGEEVPGQVLFFVEGTQAPRPGSRALFPAAFLGRLAPGETPAVDPHYARLAPYELGLPAPSILSLEGQGIPHALFGAVADGVLTIRADGGATYQQEHVTEDGRRFVLSFERVTRTTLPAR